MLVGHLNSYLGELDTLQYEAFGVLDDIIAISKPDTPASDSIETTRSRLVKSCTKIIIKYQQLLTILEINTKQAPGIHRKPAETITELYRDKLARIKHQLQQTQLTSYRLEQEFIHKQRLDKFGNVPERQQTFAEMKQQLFEGKSEEKQLQKKNVDQQILEHNKSITASLQNTRQLMTTSILQTELNIDSLDQQTKDLTTYDSLIVDFGETLKKSKNIVRFIEKQDRLDKRRIYISIGFLLACCAWVLWRRVLKLPVKLLLWSLLKIFRIFSWMIPTNPRVEIKSVDDLQGSKVGQSEYEMETMASTVITEILTATGIPEISTMTWIKDEL